MKIISGGQTGVDRAALDVALELGLSCGGWCPAGRRAEDGRIPDRYPLDETPTAEYVQRTDWNVRDSAGTLILTIGKPTGGTATTIAFAQRHQRPCLVVDLAMPVRPAVVNDWLNRNQITVLNVAGPRASTAAQGYDLSTSFLKELWAGMR